MISKPITTIKTRILRIIFVLLLIALLRPFAAVAQSYTDKVLQFERLMREWKSASYNTGSEKYAQLKAMVSEGCKMSEYIAKAYIAEQNASTFDIRANTWFQYIKENRISISLRDLREETGKDGRRIVYCWIKYIQLGKTDKEDFVGFKFDGGKIFYICNDDMERANRLKTDSDHIGVDPTPIVPFSITSCTVSNVDYDGNSLPFDAAHTQYLKPEIRYTCNTSGSYDIYVKLYDASGSLSTGSSSPSGYTQMNSGISLSSGSGSIKLKGWGNTTSGNWRAGTYRYEFYYNGTLLYTYRFTVPEGTSTGGSSVSSSTDLDITVSGVTFKMKYVPGGTFRMGSDAFDAFYGEMPVHTVTLSRDYYIGETEVTQGLWKAVMGSNPSEFNKGDNYPVDNVSWNDCQMFISKLNQNEEVKKITQRTGLRFRLPTEAEWEYAARGGNKSRGYKYSGSNTLSSVAWYGYDARSDDNRTITERTTKPVKLKSPNELGIYDMSGNVWEWCEDNCGKYPSGSVTDPNGSSPGPLRVLRGGSWLNDVSLCRVSYRANIDAASSHSVRGLRLALVP